MWLFIRKTMNPLLRLMHLRVAPSPLLFFVESVREYGRVTFVPPFIIYPFSSAMSDGSKIFSPICALPANDGNAEVLSRPELSS
jgi:hypothetical protein